MTEWQVQEAKQQFSSLLRSSEDEGPQVITRHGHQVAVLMNMDMYQSLVKPKRSVIDFLLGDGPSFDGVELERDRSLIDLDPVDLSDFV
jgi:prevent-host-death family protein